VREVRTIEERHDYPPESEIDPEFGLQLRLGVDKVRRDEEPIDQEELEICKHRGHVMAFGHNGWGQCRECMIWVRENRSIEEREDKPPMDDFIL
jgi:hypothetical protein